MVSGVQRKALQLLIFFPSPSLFFGLGCDWLKKTSWLKKKRGGKKRETSDNGEHVCASGHT